MFWNKKKKDSEETEQDIYEYEGELSDGEDEDAVEESNETEDEAPKDAYYEDDEDYDESYNGEDLEEISEEGETGEEDTEALTATVTVKVDSLNSLSEFISERRPFELQFMRKGSDEVFSLREAHFRIAKVWGTVSMSRECSADEYARIALATELLDKADDFYVLPALTESDLKDAMADFCEEKYGAKGRKNASNPKKFARVVEENGDKEEWKIYVKEFLYKKTEDFCEENGITFSGAEEEEINE